MVRKYPRQFGIHDLLPLPGVKESLAEIGMMKRWVIDRHSRSSLRMEEANVRMPAPREVLVRVSAVALNARDSMIINDGMGLKLAFPFVPGSDMAGVVEAIGSGCQRFSVGDRVLSNFMPEWIDGKPKGTAQEPSYRTLGGHYPGVLAEYVTFSEEWFTAAPKTQDDAHSSTLPVAGLTPWFSLVEQGHIKAGETVFLPGTGGVALFALQIAVGHSADVIIASSDEEKLGRARSLGATHSIHRRHQDVVQEVLSLTSGRGVDHVLELVDGKHLEQSIAMVAVGGRVSIIGLQDFEQLSSPTIPILLKAPTIQGTITGHRRSFEDFVRAVDRLNLEPVFDKQYTFAELPAAFEHLDRGAFGKLVITVT